MSGPRADAFAAGGSFGMSPVHQNVPAYSITVDLIRSEHLTAARTTVRDPEILRELELEIDRDCDGLRSFLFATQVRLLTSARVEANA